jgi:hypothetical protein
MAEALKRQYDIVALRVAMSNASRNDVTFTLQAKVDDELRDLKSWRTTVDALGLDSHSGQRPTQRVLDRPDLPGRMLAFIRNYYETDPRGRRPLWVHVVAPYGALRFVAWERVLGRALSVPVLMLPDFIFPPPLDTEEELEVLVCGSAPLGHEHWSVLNAMRTTVRCISNAVDRRVHLQVFTDQAIYDTLIREWTGLPGFAEQVTMHDPATARPFADEDDEPRATSPYALRSPWLRWMAETLSGHSVDVAHFVCHGYLSGGHGALLFAQSPLGRTDRYLAAPVRSPELHSFLTTMGAWASSFVSVPDNYSELGLRAVIDDIAETRPGPLVMNATAVDPTGEALTDAYGFLFGRTRRSPPASEALCLYCQPYLDPSADVSANTSRAGRRSVADPAGMSTVFRNEAQRAAADFAEEKSPLEGVYAGSPRVSGLVASTARFAEEVQLKYQQLARDEVASPEQCDHDAKLAKNTLERLTQFVATRATSGTPE